MLLSYSWLKEFVPFKIAPEKLREAITLHIAEVEGMQTLPSGDTIFEIENKSLTHRPDLFSHFGIARELATIFDLPFHEIKLLKKFSSRKSSSPFSVKVESKNDTPRFMAVVAEGIRVEPSPAWMQKKLLACGIEPINNIVDITNYITLEFGQPTHVFDYDTLEGHALCIRRAKKSEKIQLLNGKQYNLDSEVLVIADAKKPQDIAGIMGGEVSKISPHTRNMVLTSANFHKTLVRKTSQRFGLRTDASLRFEKGLAVCFSEYGIFRGMELLQKYAHAKSFSAIYDFGEKPREKNMNFDPASVERLIGVNMGLSKIQKFFKHLGFRLQEKKLSVPVWRTDVHLSEDVVEEVARMYGYYRIQPQPLQAALVPVKSDPVLSVAHRIRDILAGIGFMEISLYSFALQGEIALRNPVAPNLKYLRTSLKENLLKYCNELPAQDKKQAKFFEIGHVFGSGEKRHLGIFTSDYFEAKGVLQLLKNKLLLSEKIGILKDISGAGYFELDLGEITKKIQGKHASFQALRKYPSVEADVSFWLEKSISWEAFEKEVKHELLKTVELFDVYEQASLPKKSFALHLTFQSQERTLTNDEVQYFIKNIIDHLQQKFGAELRKK